MGVTRRMLLMSAPALIVPGTVAVAATPERPDERLHRLCEEVQHALSDWCSGQFYAEVYPANHLKRRFSFHAVDYVFTPQERLARASAAYMRAAHDIDPRATQWFEGRAVGDNPSGRFSLIGSWPYEGMAR